MAVELKLRRDIDTDIDAMTPAEGEPIYDTTNKRLRVGDGSIAGGTPLAVESETATGSTSARSMAVRFADVLNVKDYGAKGDAADSPSTDDSAAINLAFDALRTAIVANESVPRIVYFPPGRYRVDSGINATNIEVFGWAILGHGAVIEGHTTGKAVLDMMESRFGYIAGLTIIGDATDVPKFGIQIGTIDGTSADGHYFDKVSCRGTFSKACLYNFGSESCLFNGIRLFNDHDNTGTSYCLILDSHNDFSVASDYVTITSPTGTAVSFNENTFISLDARKSNSGPTIYIGGQARRFKFVGSYAVSFDDAVLELSNSSIAITDLYLDLHCETQQSPGLLSCIKFTNANSGTLTPIYKGFTYIDHSPHAKNQVFDANGVTTVVFENLNLSISNYTVTPTNGVFNPKAKFSVYGGTLFVRDGTTLTNIDNMNATIITNDRDDVTFGDGTQLVLDAVNDSIGFKGDVRFWDSATTDVAAGALGNTGETRMEDGQLWLKSDIVNNPGATTGFAKLFVDSNFGELQVTFSDGRKRTLSDSATNSITSGTTQTQVGATALTTIFNRVTTHANVDDGVKLPTAVPGLKITILNGTATADLQVWPATGDAIESAGVNAVGVTKIASAATTTYEAVDATTWYITNLAHGVAATFTPTVAFATNGDFTPTYNTQFGQYTRVADLIHFSILLDFDTNAYTTASGNLQIGGLPFAADSGNSGRWAFAVSRHGNVNLGSGKTQIGGELSAGNSFLQLWESGDAVAAAVLTTSNFAASTSNFLLRMSGFYAVA